MTRLILFVCAVVALSSVTFAAPLAEEDGAAQQIIEKIDNLLMNADPEENDIAHLIEALDSTAEAQTTSSPVKDDATVEVEKEQAITEEETTVQVTPTSASLTDVVVPSDVPTVEQKFQDMVQKLIEEYGETVENTPTKFEKQEETVEKVQEISTNATKKTDVKPTTEQEELPIPVTEVIPPPKKAFVLGEYADEQTLPEPAQNENDTYKIVLGVTEDGTPFLSEYQPDALLNNQEEVRADAPLVEQTNYDYPEEPIRPGAEFRPFRGPMVDHSEDMYDDYNPGPRSGPSIDYNPGPISESDRDYVPDYETPNPDYDQSNDYFNGMNKPSESMQNEMSFYHARSPLDDMLDYADDFSSMTSDDSHDYDVVPNRTGDDHTIPDDMPPLMPLMGDDIPASRAIEPENISDVIVAGLHENYHPEPIPGMIPFTTEFPDNNQGTFDPNDAPILPSAMVNLNSPAAESTRHQDEVMETPIPDFPYMVDLPRPVSEFTVRNQPMAGMQLLDADNVSSMDGNDLEMNRSNPSEDELAELAGRPTLPINGEETSAFDFDIDSQSGVVIQLDIESQQALVNGKPFPIKQSASILGFIGEMLEAARMRSRIPPRSDFSQERGPNYDQYAASYMHPSSYDEERTNQPSSFYNDYLPYNYFTRALRKRLLEARFNKMRSFDGGYGYDYTPMRGYNSIRGYDDSMQGYQSRQGYNPMSGYNFNREYDDSMQGYNSILGYDDSMQGYNPMQGYNSYRKYDDSMHGYNPMQGYGPDYYQYW